MAHVEQQVLIYSDGGTMYRVRENPDAAPGNNAGLVLEWKDPTDSKLIPSMDSQWKDYFFIAPDAIEPIAQALLRIAKDSSHD
jgi:hypothetical protein